jgi:hypothetical protein
LSIARNALRCGDELARAVRTEAAAVQWHWGVSVGVVHRWRRFLDVTQASNARSHELLRASARAGAKTQRTETGRPRR